MGGNRFDRVDSQIVKRDSVAVREERGVQTEFAAPAPAPIAGAMDARARDTLASRDRSCRKRESGLSASAVDLDWHDFWLVELA